MDKKPIMNIPQESGKLRAEWSRPEVRRIDARQAEFTVIGAGDAASLS